MNASAVPYIPRSGMAMPTVQSLLIEIQKKDITIHNLSMQLATAQIHLNGFAKNRDERIASLDEENKELNSELTSVREVYDTQLAELRTLRDQHSEKEATLRSLLEENNSLKADIETQKSRHLAEKDEMEKTIAELRTALFESQKIVLSPVQQTTLPDINSIISEHTGWLDKLSHDLQSELSCNTDKIHPGFRMELLEKFTRRLVMINVGLMKQLAPEKLSPSTLNLISSSPHISSVPSLGAVFRERMLSQ